jgi:hypothetical protein
LEGKKHHNKFEMEEEDEERISHHMKGQRNELPTFNRIL